MPRVSLIVLRAAGSPWPGPASAAARAALEEAGYAVEVLVVADPAATPSVDLVEPWARSLVAPGPGLARMAVAGLREGRGDHLAVLDPGRGYRPEDLIAAVDRLVEGRSRVVVVAARAAAASASGLLARALIGSAEPTAGLIALTREAAAAADGRFRPAGPRFVAEILGRADGPRSDLLVDRDRTARGADRVDWLDDVRLIKRLADDRFGTASRLVQFCGVGASGMVVDLAAYAGLQAALSRTGLARVGMPMIDATLDLVASAVLAIGLALTWNFSINRRLTFNDARAGSLGRQYARYAAGNLLGIAVSLAIRLGLPGVSPYFGRHRLAAAVAGIVAATGIGFAMARWFVFGRKAPAASPAPAVATGPKPRLVRLDRSSEAMPPRAVATTRRASAR